MPQIPSLLVLDCTVTVPWYLTDEANALTERLFTGLGRSTYIVPVLWRLEFISAMRAAHRRGRIPSERLAAIFAQAGKLPLTQEHLTLDVAQVATGCERFGLTPYDYVYLALARAHGAPLATMDGALVRACQQAGVPVVTDPPALAEPVAAYRARPARRQAPGRRPAR
ncbi:MAG: type II toxin-antitoxin system VapC family toxin [Pseudomonadota bacterium]